MELAIDKLIDITYMPELIPPFLFMRGIKRRYK